MQIIRTKKFTWVDIPNPEQEDLDFLKKEYGFHELNLEDCLSEIQRPKIDSAEDYLFIVLHFPRYLKNIKRMISSEVDIFLGKDFLVTVHAGNLKPLKNFFEGFEKNPKELEELTKKGSAMLLYELISHLFEYCIPILDKIGERLSRVDYAIFKDNPSFVVPELAKLNQEIITFRKIVSPERRVMRELEEKIKPYMAGGNELYFDDITDLIEKIWDNLENFKEVSQSLQSSHDSYVSYKLNEVMKILTVFSAILLPLTVITSFYGMNVDGLPMAQSESSALLLAGGMTALVLLMLYFFRKKDIL